MVSKTSESPGLFTRDHEQYAGEKEPWHAQATSNGEQTNTLAFLDGNLSKGLRIVGAGALVCSAVIYMLSGFTELDIAIRHWAYLILIAVLTIGGLVSQRLFSDPKGARLLFALSALMVPVQTTHISSIIQGILNGSPPSDPIAFFSSVTISIIIGGASAFLGISILARPHAKLLSGIFLLFNLVLALPFRDALSTALVLSFGALILAQLHLRVFSQSSRYFSAEGIATQILLTAPLIIFAARFLFYINDATAYSFIFLIVGLMGSLVALKNIERGLNCVYAFICFVVLGVGIVGFTHNIIYTMGGFSALYQSYYWILIFTLPAITSLYFGHKSKQYKLYNTLASTFIICLGLSLLDNTINAWLIYFLILMLFLITAVRRQSKMMLFVFSLLSIASSIKIILCIPFSFSMFSWVGLAISGVTLVILSSLIEKYGTTAKQSLQKVWISTKDWHY